MKRKYISYKLALAIGWTPKDIRMEGNICFIFFKGYTADTGCWMIFDYKSAFTIYSIAEEYDCFPTALVDGDYSKAKVNGKPTIVGWECIIWSYKRTEWKRVTATTPQEAIALAVINRNKKHNA